MVAGSLNIRQIQRGREGDHEGAVKGTDGGPRSFSRDDTRRGSVGSDSEGGGEGR